MATKQGGIKDIAVTRGSLYFLAPDDIHVREGWNARDINDPENAAHIEQLISSISQVGVKTPLKVKWEDGKAYLTDGHCRLEAVRELIKQGTEIKSVPAITENQYASEADLAFTQIVSNSGKNLSPFEQGKIFKRLIDFGWSEIDIARKAGIAKQRVVDLLNLQAAPTDIADMVKAGEVSSTLAIATTRKNKGDGKKAAKELATAVAKAKKSGKAKASPRFVSGSGKTFKTEIREIFSRTRPFPLAPATVAFEPKDRDRLIELGLLPRVE